MNYRDIPLHIEYKKFDIEHDGYEPHMTCYVPETSGKYAGKGVLILPGGGYAFTSDREGEPVALALAAYGIPAFVLWYSVAPNRYPSQLLEVGTAVSEIYGQYPQIKELYLCGFSAGGHLAGHYATTFKEVAKKYFSAPPEKFKVVGEALCYPVVMADEVFCHADSFKNLLGDKYKKLKDKVSVDKLVDGDTPRAFIWSTYADSAVPILNSFSLASAFAKNKVPCEVHVFEDGPHGLSVASTLVGAKDFRHADWVRMFTDWLLL